MSISRQFSDGGRPEKSNFLRTCNRLSRYVKEKGSLRDLTLEIGGKVESLEVLMKPGSIDPASTSATMNLLTNMEKSAQPLAEQRPALDSIRRVATPDLSINKSEDTFNKVGTSKDATTAESKAAPLTIFYSGRLLVFDDYPADKATELLTFAKNISPEMSFGILSNTMQEKPNHSNSEATNSSTNVGMASSSRSANGSDLPIARRSSLHRFLVKRKDRAAARGPYQVQEQPASSSKGDEQLELKL